MKTVLAATFILLMVLLACMTGCAIPTPSPASVVSPTGTDVDKAGAFVTSAESAVVAAKPHADAVGQADLGLASNAHKSATASLTSAKADLATIQTQVAARDQTIVTLKAEYAAIESGWGYRLQGIVTKGFIILMILLGIHLLGGAASIFAPPPYGLVAGVVAKLVNPLGWFTWVIQKFAKVPA